MKRKIQIGYFLLTLIPSFVLWWVFIPSYYYYGLNTDYYILMDIAFVTFLVCWPSSILAFLFWPMKQNKFVWRVLSIISLLGLISILYLPSINYTEETGITRMHYYTSSSIEWLTFFSIALIVPLVFIALLFTPVIYSLFKLSFPQNKSVKAQVRKKKK